MTTSILSHMAGELRPNDLQTVRDFALEAPWEWRKALEALCDDSEALEAIGMTVDEVHELEEKGLKVEELEGEVERLREELEVAEKNVKDLKEAAEAVLAAEEGPVSGRVKTMEAAMNALQEVVDDA